MEEIGKAFAGGRSYLTKKGLEASSASVKEK